ncbi:right-handed parallel beta-helix repeat-containing protein [Kitasatospora arboriphila]
MHHCPGGGISAIDADHVTIDHNHVYGNAWFSVFGQSGISILTAKDSDAGDGRTYKIRITANTVHDNETRVKWEHCQCYSDGNGIIIDTLKGHDYKGRVLVANNVSYDNGGSGIHSYKSQHVDIVHNTAYQNGRSTRMDPYANIYAQDSTDVRVLNNVTSGRPGQPTNSQHRDVDVTYDYNVYYGGRAPEVKGPHDIVADPRFVKPGTGAGADFRLGKGSPAIGTAEPFPAVTTDITGAEPSAARLIAGPTPSSGTARRRPLLPRWWARTTAPRRIRSPPRPPGRARARPLSTSASPGNDVRATGDGESLARTGANVVVPLGMAAAALALGGGIIFLIRRKRS